MKKNTLILGSVNGFLAVSIGAFGAHAISPLLSEYSKDIFETGSKYHFYHSLALLLCAMIPQTPKWVPFLFSSGIVFFSGSLYLLAITQNKFLGYITPIGGVMFLAAWLGLLWQALRQR